MDIWKYTKDPIEKKILQGRIKNKVFQNVNAYDGCLNLRRSRLQRFLNDEEHELRDELKQLENINIEYMVQKQNEELRLFEEQKKKEEEENLAKKFLQLDMIKCKQIQPLIRKRRDLEIYETQQKQIKEQREKCETAKEVDKMWYVKMLGDAEKSKELEQKRINEKIRKEAEMKGFLTAQMLISQEIKRKEKLKETEESIKVVDECEKKLTTRVDNELRKRSESKMKLAEDLKTQINDIQNRKKKDREAEIRMETEMTKSCLTKQEELNRSKTLALEKQRKEFELYGQHAVAVKQERQAREKAEEVMIAEEARKHVEEIEKRIKLEAKKSVDLLKETLCIRESQLNEKKKESEKAAQRADEEMRQRKFKEVLAKEEALKQKQESLEMKNLYKQFLDEQMKRKKMSEETQKNQLLLEIKQKEEEEKQFNEKITQLMKRDFSTEKTHPFAKSAEDCSVQKVPETSYCRYNY